MSWCCGCADGERTRRQKEKGIEAILESVWASRPATEEAPNREEESCVVTMRDIEERECGRGLSDVQDFEEAYELGEVVGRGSTSTVYKCRQRSSGRTYATKVIGEEQLRAEFGSLAAQFETEIAALRACRHPNIIRLEDAVMSRGKLYLVMEYLTGGELFDYVVDKGTLSEAEAADVLRHLTSAIAYMHAKGVVHRDLKPENLLLTAKKEIKIIDFGLSKMLPEPDIQATSFLGTRGYLAPEMLKRQAYTKAVDMWALGVIAYILLCGCLPFDDEISQLSSPLLSRKFLLRYPSWASGLSRNAKSFLAALLQVDPAKRLTADAALDHVWLRAKNIPHLILRSPALIKDKVPKTPKLGRTRQPPKRPPNHNRDPRLRPPQTAAGGAAARAPGPAHLPRKNSF
mmetsp:Transcript_7760/g.23704  ORF Transcript_7760/g.23704 Transcript_7760/m.23704 type:complete len:402 (-) Transcript_7760:176-1381(-)